MLQFLLLFLPGQCLQFFGQFLPGQGFLAAYLFLVCGRLRDRKSVV